jgi:hypothetical protein
VAGLTTGHRAPLHRVGANPPHGRRLDPVTARSPGRSHGLEPAQVEPSLARLLVHAAGAGDPAAVPGLSARARYLAVVHRRQDRPPRRVHRPRELRVAARRLDLLGLDLQHATLHDRRQRHQIRRRPLSCAAAQPVSAVQGADSRRDPDSVHRADGPLGHRVLVDLRHPVLDHLLVAAKARPDRNQHRLPRRPVERALVDHLRQHLARRAVRGDHAARRTADRVALALRGGDARRRLTLADVPLHHLSAADADHRRGDDVLGAVHLHRLPTHLGDDPRRSGQRHAPDGDALLSARDHGRPTRRGRGDRDRDDPVPVGRNHDLLVRPAAPEMA